MTSPNVGQVTIGVGITDDGLAKRLTKSILDEIKPALDGWHNQLEVISKDIEKINKAPIDQVAKEIGEVRKESTRTSAALLAQTKRANELSKLESRLVEVRKQRTAAVAKARREEKKYGEASQKTADLVKKLTSERDDLLEKSDVKAGELALANQRVLETRAADEKRYTDAVQREINRRVKAKEDEAREIRRQIDEMVKDAERRTEAEYKAGRQEVKDRDKANADLARQDAQRTKDEEREQKARTRAAEREQNKQLRQAQRSARDKARAEARERRKQVEDSLFETLSSFGKKLGGLSQIGMPVGLAAIAIAVFDLVAMLSALSGALGLLPGAFGAAQAAMGTFRLATFGVEDAIGALVDGDLENFAEALAKLSPSTQQAMLSLQALWPEFVNIQQTVQETFFAGLNKELYDLANVYLPMTEEGLTSLSAIFNDYAKIVTDALVRPDIADSLQNAMDSVIEAFEYLKPAIEPLVEAFATIMEVSAGFLPQLSNIFVELAMTFSGFIQDAADSGELEDWIQRGIRSLIDLTFILEDLISIFLKMGEAGEGILYTLTEALDGLNKMLPDTSHGIGALFAPPILSGLALLGKGFDATATAIRGIGNAAIWAYNQVAKSFEMMRGPLSAVYKPVQIIGRALGKDMPDLPTLSPLPYMDMTPDPQLPRLPGTPRNLTPWNQRFGDKPRRGDYQFPGNLPVPSPPARDADGSKVTDSERKKAIADAIEITPIDPFAPIGGAQNQPGYPGRPPLNVEIDNLPQMGGMSMLPGMAALPGMALPAEAGYIPIGGGRDAMGAKSFIDALVPFAESVGLSVASGVRNEPGSYHHTGNAGDFSNVGRMGPPTPEMTAFANTLISRATPFIQELIYAGSPVNILDGKTVPTINQPGSPYSDATSGYHGDHVHVAVKDGMAEAFLAALQGANTSMQLGSSVPTSLKDSMFDVNGPLTIDPATGETGYMQVDQQAVRDAKQSLIEAGHSYDKANQRLQETLAWQAENLATEQDVIEARNDVQEREADVIKRQEELAEKERGSWKGMDSNLSSQKSKQWRLEDQPWGSPQRILGSMLQAMGANGDSIEALVAGSVGGLGINMGTAAGGVLAGVAGDAVRDAAAVQLPGPMGYPGVPTAPSTDPKVLAAQGNPLVIAQMSGFNVPDYTRQGGGDSAQNLTLDGGPPTDAMGRMYSDTAALIDRTFSNQNAEDKARHDQIMAVLNDVKARLGGDLLAPVVEQGVAEAFESSAQAVGTAIGQAAGPIIGNEVAAAIPNNTGGAAGTGSAMVTTGANAITGVIGAIAGNAKGGPIVGPGTGTSDSILARLSNGEWVLTAAQVKALGGFKGVQSLVSGLPQYATGGGVNVDKTVGADFFGVAQVPILGALINLLVAVLLRVIDVQIEARDTLNEISSEFREYRGDFQAFDAAGRLMNDTSGLIDRSGSSEQAAADERIRILKLVLEGLFKYIVERIIVPIGKAIGNALLQAAGNAVSGALSGAFPGGEIVGGAVSSIITSAGSAGIDIVAEIGTDFALAAADIGLDAAGQLLQTLLPGVTNAVFGGGLLAALFDPLTSAINGIVGGVSMLFGGLFGGLSTLIPGLPFDEGGVAVGTGLMPKATLAPERVLSPRQTMLFEKMVSALESGPGSSSSRSTTIHAPFTVVGGEQAGRQARDRLLALMS